MNRITKHRRARHPADGRGLPRRTRGALATLVLGAALLVSPAVASAAELPSGNPSLDEYVESLPDAGGDQAPKPGQVAPGGSGASALPAPVREELGSTPQDQLLERVATSPELGAPKAPKRASRPEPDATGGALGGGSSQEPPFFSALASAVREPEGAPLLVILAMLVGMVLAAGAAAARRNRLADQRR